ERGAGEVVVLGPWVVAADAGEPLGSVAFAATQHLWIERRRLVRIELDRPGDDAGPGPQVGELALEPVGCRPRGSGGGRDETLLAAERKQPLSGRVEPEPAGAARAASRTLKQRQPQPEDLGALASDLARVVRAAVEHDDRLEAVVREGLGGERL